jgi:Flp pilus assembly protein TadB
MCELFVTHFSKAAFTAAFLRAAGQHKRRRATRVKHVMKAANANTASESDKQSQQGIESVKRDLQRQGKLLRNRMRNKKT